MSSTSPEGNGPRRALGESDNTALPPRSDEAGSPQRVVGGEHRTNFFASSAWTVAAAVVPPIGLIRSGRKVLGWLLLGLSFLAVIGAAFVVMRYGVKSANLLTSFLNQQALISLGVAVGVVGLLWVMTIGYTHLRTRPVNPPWWQRATGAVLVGLLSFLVATPAAVAVRYTYDTASLLGDVFGEGQSQTRPTIDTNSGEEDPFGGHLRILLLGGDDGFDRAESAGSRTDTNIVADINTTTGAVTLISLPRNMARMPFPPDSPFYKFYPNGFYDGYNADNAEYFLNAMYDNVPATVGKDILGPTDNIGADVLKTSIGYALGIDIDYYVMINLNGFKDLIDALGGITVNINYNVPKGGSQETGPPAEYLYPGPNQHLNGTDALWFARGRYGLDDYSRMERQRCVISAVAKQADPLTLLTRYEAIAKAGKKIIRTDIPGSVLSTLLPLATKVQAAGRIDSIVFRHGVQGFRTTNPDFDMMRERVKAAEAQAASDSPTKTATPSASSSPSASASSSSKPSSSKSTSPSATASPTEVSEDTTDACAYNPR